MTSSKKRTALAAHIGQTIQYCMDRAGLTRTEVARRAGIAPSSLFRYLNGDMLPSVEMLARLLEVTQSRWRDLEK